MPKLRRPLPSWGQPATAAGRLPQSGRLTRATTALPARPGGHPARCPQPPRQYPGRYPGRATGYAPAGAHARCKRTSQAAVEAEQVAEGRLAQLEAKAATEMLSEQEEVESIRLERRVRNLAAVITRLETEIAQAKETMDIDGFVAQWAPLADAEAPSLRGFPCQGGGAVAGAAWPSWSSMRNKSS